jgi:CMD domain protein
VALLHTQLQAAGFYADGLAARDAALAALVRAEAAKAAATGPFGRFPAGILSREDSDGHVHRTDAALGAKLAAGLDHAHMLLFHPRDASPAHLRRLVDAGWTTPAIVTLSQLVAFLSFQIRVVAGLRAMAEAA